MNDALLLTAAAAATVLATGLGAIPVMLLGDRAAAFEPALSGLAIGVMAVAAVVGLLVPAVQDGGPVEVLAGIVIGAGGLWWAGHRLRARFVTEEREGRADRLAVLTFGVLLVHSLPEGLAIGAAWEASGGLATFVILAIAIQNIPEGTAVAVALEQAGRGPWEQFRAAVLSSAPQVPGALRAGIPERAVPSG